MQRGRRPSRRSAILAFRASSPRAHTRYVSWLLLVLYSCRLWCCVAGCGERLQAGSKLGCQGAFLAIVVAVAVSFAFNVETLTRVLIHTRHTQVTLEPQVNCFRGLVPLIDPDAVDHFFHH